MNKNFFAIKQLTDNEKMDVIIRINNNDYEGAKKMLNKITTPTHIGLYKDGWKFLFDWNYKKFYELNRESINNYLSNNMRIVDDEFNEITLESFWELIDSSSGGLDNEKYYSMVLNECDRAFLLLEEFPPYDLTQYNPKYYEFYSDNLRFSTAVDFR